MKSLRRVCEQRYTAVSYMQAWVASWTRHMARRCRGLRKA
jgi:hypothetical protein